MIEVRTPANQFFDTDGSPLDSGYIYIGTTGANPETTPQAVYWDKAGTIPAAQPIRTVNGFPARDGAASKFYTSTKNYSITVKDKRGSLVIGTLNSDSGVFDELAETTGAAEIGYDNTSSGMAATDVQAAIDELDAAIETVQTEIDSLSFPFSGMNLIANSAFLVNQREYVSGTPTTIANQYTLDRWRVVVSGESLSWVAGAFGNRVTAPAGGIEQVIEGNRIVGGDYACTWSGSGTLQVNGVFKSKNETFTLTSGANATIKLVGEVEQIMLSRPESITRYEYDAIHDLTVCRWYTKREVVLIGGSNTRAWISMRGTTSVYRPETSLGAMRAIPTITLLNNSNVQYLNGASVWTATAITCAVYPYSDAILFFATCAADSSGGGGVSVRKSTAGDVVAILSAEL